jgi:hypothetical protein
VRQAPGGGLPQGWALWCLLAVELVPESHWDSFPGSQARRPPVARTLRLEGGSLLRTGGLARRTYLPYDLPRVILEDADPAARLEIEGGTLEEAGAAARSGWSADLPGSPVRAYLVRAADAPLVRLKAVLSGRPRDELAFAVAQDHGSVLPVQQTLFRIDRLGSPSGQGEGAGGADVPDAANDYRLTWLEDRYWYRGWNDPDDRPFELLEWLANRQGRVPYGKVRDHLLGRDDTINPAYEVKALAQLAHVELETDPRGRWAYVHPLPCCLYCLPTKREGCFQAVL